MPLNYPTARVRRRVRRRRLPGTVTRDLKFLAVWPRQADLTRRHCIDRQRPVTVPGPATQAARAARAPALLARRPGGRAVTAGACGGRARAGAPWHVQAPCELRVIAES